MLPLTETVIGFVAIMLVLSLLVKSLTSLVKSHVDYYSANFKAEIERLVRGTLNRTLSELENDKSKKNTWLKDIQWRRLGDQFLTVDNMTWVLKKLGATDDDLKGLAARLEVHKANIQYAFEMRTKNISLVAGLVLCLGLNINAFTLWKTLYSDQQLRAAFAGPYAEAALKLEESTGSSGQSAGANAEVPAAGAAAGAGPAASPASVTPSQTEANAEQEKEKLEKRTDTFVADLRKFQSDVSFGMGKVWREKPSQGKEVQFLLYEFFGSLLTGLLVSVGAPYWHDLLRALASLRDWKKPAASDAPKEAET